MSGSADIPTPVGRWRVDHVAIATSTNTELLAAAEAGSASDRTALMADHQTAGRGRLDRRWDAPSGTNLLVSLLFLEPAVRPSTLTQMVGLAALTAVERLGPLRPDSNRMGLKWPNDILLDEAKLAGILAQRSTATGAVVVGIGLNIGWAPDGAASLSGNLGIDVSPRTVLDAMLNELDAFDALEERGDDLEVDVAERYVHRLSTIGQDVRVELPGDRFLDGRATGVDDHGRLLVEDEVGDAHVLDVGDVVHVRRRETRSDADGGAARPD
jgi:BirA family transcriptional regulator, biotin operon repressor / biotin---[acetyl-CoA-carboxylase] ligase